MTEINIAQVKTDFLVGLLKKAGLNDAETAEIDQANRFDTPKPA